MTTQNPDLPVSIEEREFSTTRKGYDKREVRAFLGELENNFRELEQWAQDAKLRLQQAEYEAQKVKDEQGQSVDAAIAAVLEAKDRILERARKQATQIEADAQSRADEILAGVGVSPSDLPEDVDDATRQAAAIIEEAQREAAAMRKTVQEAEERVKDLSVERDRVREEIDALIAETKVTDSAEGIEIDPVGTMRRVEERSMEIISDAEAPAAAMRTEAAAESDTQLALRTEA